MKPGATRKTLGARATPIGKARLAAMIEEATVDAYDDAAQATGWFTMLEQHLDLPFDTTVLGATVTVSRVELRGDCHIVVVCTRGRDRQAISIVDLPLPSPRPAGADRIDAYRQWLGGRW